MNIFNTSDGMHYRRWLNVIPTFLLPGSAQFLSGRKTAGIAIFLLYALFCATMVGILVHPRIGYSVIQRGLLDWVICLFGLLIAGDSLRRPIPRLGFRNWVILLAVSLAVIFLPTLAIRTFLIQPFKIPTGAMAPTIMGNRTDANGNPILGDHIFVNKLIYRLAEPHRGDVIVFRTKGLQFVNQDTFFIKRIAGLPGETIGVVPPYILVNEAKVTTPAIFSMIAEEKNGYSGFCPAMPGSPYSPPLSSPSARITLGPDEYLALGDNTRSSLDGRYFGPINRKAIIGKAVYIYAPADRKRKIE